jgi:hypothetical protein
MQHKNIQVPKAIRKLFHLIQVECVTNTDLSTLGCTKCMEAVTALFGLCCTAITKSTAERFVGWRHGPQGLHWSRGDDLPSTNVVRERIFAASAGALKIKSFLSLLKKNCAYIAGGTLIAACKPAYDAAATTSDIDVYVPTLKHVHEIGKAMVAVPWVIDSDGEISQDFPNLKITANGKVLRLEWRTYTNTPVRVDIVPRTLGSEPSHGAPIRYNQLPSNWGLAAGFDLPACSFSYNLKEESFEWSPSAAQSIATKTIHLCASHFLHRDQAAKERRHKYIDCKGFVLASPAMRWTHDTGRYVGHRAVAHDAGRRTRRSVPCGFFSVHRVA